MHALKSSLIRFELKTYQGVKQLWTKWAKFKRYVKLWKEEGGSFFYSSLSFSVLSCKSQKKRKTKTKKLFPHNGVRSWLAYPKSLRFQVFSLFLIFRDRTRCMAKSIRSREDKKKLSLTVSDSPLSRKVHGKEHTQSGKALVRE